MTMVQSMLRGKEMQVETGHSKLTYDDLLGLPDDDLRHEIIDGVHYVTPAPVTRHQRILVELLYLLRHHLGHPSRGTVFVAPFDVVLSPHDAVEPDLVYVVEILSPGTSRRDLGLKRDQQAGVLEYWIVDPDRDELIVYRRTDEHFGAPEVLSKASADAVTTPLLPGLTIPLTRIFSM